MDQSVLWNQPAWPTLLALLSTVWNPSTATISFVTLQHWSLMIFVHVFTQTWIHKCLPLLSWHYTAHSRHNCRRGLPSLLTVFSSLASPTDSAPAILDSLLFLGQTNHTVTQRLCYAYRTIFFTSNHMSWLWRFSLDTKYRPLPQYLVLPLALSFLWNACHP